MTETEHEDSAQRLLRRVRAGLPSEHDPVTHVETVPARAQQTTDWPDWAPDEVTRALTRQGIRSPWRHQTEAAETAWAGENVVVATGTASGKSLTYQLPVLSALQLDNQACALYLAPTKALGNDQLQTVTELDLAGIRPARYDGDTPHAERDWARAHGRWLFSNPDMLHRGILPNHTRWAGFLRGLKYVVLDECHSYRGLFGSHVALLLRRLRRVTRHYGADPVFLLASATTAAPAEFAAELCGATCVPITGDTSPRGARTVALCEPPLQPDTTGENEAPVRRSAGSEAARVLAELAVEGARTLVFVRSRQSAEITALTAQRTLTEVDPDLATKVAAYRGGLLPEERRQLEAALTSGELLGAATTSALELGVDITGLDAVVVAGYPGTLASFWQQAGRAGRAASEALVVFIARDDPMDTYLANHPAAMLHRPVEATVIDSANRYVLAPQLACAAAELPITAGELAELGGTAAREVLDELVASKTLRRRNSGWYWTSRNGPQPHVDIRGSGGEQVAIVEADTARLLGTVDPAAACSTIYPGAVYLHQGASYVIDELDLDEALAMAHHEAPEWTTSPQEVTDISVLRVLRHEDHGSVRVSLGEVATRSRVVGYLRKRPTGEVIDQCPLELPEQVLHTRAAWYTISAETLETVCRTPGGSGVGPARLPGALHAAEHAAIGLLPLFATCDRWDIGGVSTALHGDTGEATVFVHDGYPGGAGYADRGYAAIAPWLAATREAIVACECPAGCPSCVQSPKCGNGNEPLDKAGAVTVLDVVLGAVGTYDAEDSHLMTRDSPQAADDPATPSG